VDPYVTDWLDLGLRWLHVIAGIAWIGTSFYFIRLDLSLHRPRERRDAERGVAGEFWGVHGGGFYHSQKYAVAPETLPEPLHWFKWEAYTTWLSGFALLVVLYYFDADVRLVDPEVADLETWQAVAISAGSLAVGWLVYDVLCRTVGRRSDLAVGIGVFALAALASWAMSEFLAPRAAYLQVGSILGTLMAGNVFFNIIPAHRELVRAKEEGRDPDPAPGIEAKQRSVHNNYLTLPVVFTMLAVHFPFTYGHEQAWLVLIAIMALAAWVRHFFNLWHRGRRAWPIPVSAAVGLLALAVAIEPNERSPAAAAEPVPFARVQAIVVRRCATCHSGSAAPAGVQLETAEQIRARADDIERQAVRTRAMPPQNVTEMTEQERNILAAWLAQR
jgi:uncharacterized membrane protein